MGDEFERWKIEQTSFSRPAFVKPVALSGNICRYACLFYKSGASLSPR